MYSSLSTWSVVTLRFIVWLAKSSAVVVFLTIAVGRAEPVAVPTVVVQSRSGGVQLVLDGVVEAVRQSTVSAQASGRITALTVKAGDKVRAGQVLATIDDREAGAGLQRSEAQVNQADAELRNALITLDRTRDLHSKGFVSSSALDSANTQYLGAVSSRDQAQASARQAEVIHGFTRVTAPFDGWILQTQSQVGDLAVPGKPLLTVYAPQPLRVAVQVPASRTQSIQSSVHTAVKVGGAQGETTWIVPLSSTRLPSADPVSQTTEWRFELPKKDSADLVPGQQVQVQFLPSKSGHTSRLMLPQSTVVRRGELTGVYVSNGRGFSLRAVRLGAQQANEVEILAGLKAGDEVALDPFQAGSTGAQPAKAAQ